MVANLAYGKMLDGYYTRILRAILNKTWKQHLRKQQLNGHLSSISKTTQIRWTRYVEDSRRSKGELISDVLWWTSSCKRASVEWAARIYLQQFCTDTRCSLEDLLETIDNRDELWRRVREIRASYLTWWWWQWYIYIHQSITFFRLWVFPRLVALQRLKNPICPSIIPIIMQGKVID